MHAQDNTYSRVVAWLKILLPLLALALLSTLFLVARTIDPAQDLPFSEVDVQELAKEQRIGKPNFSGLTRDGAAVTLSAARAKPDPADKSRVVGDEIRASIELPDGRRVDILANRVSLDVAARQANLVGGVSLTTSDGYTMATETLSISLAETRLEAKDGVELISPLGILTSDQFVLSGNGGKTTPYLMVFKDRVRLIYKPEP